MEVLRLGPSDDLQNILNCLNRPATIYLKGGVYPIKSVIKQSGVTLVGEGRETTILTGGDYARKIHADGREYLIMEWKSGDYRWGGYDTDYYVFLKEE